VILRIDPSPTAKHFQGVWLEQLDGTRWLIDYRARTGWRSFQDREVIVEGARYTPPPEHQSVSAIHFGVERMRLADPKTASNLVEIGPIETIRGAFSRHVWEAGSKLAGERTTTFDSGDTAYWVIDPPDDVRDGVEVEVDVRRCVRSPFVAAPGGSILWILASRLPPTG
jgi:hypothetical protein